MTATFDIIAAIATAHGRAGIGVVRVSGRALARFAEQLVGSVPAARRATRAVFRGADGAPIDEGIALYFPAPHSYTGEDVLELQGHGGPVVLQMLLRRCFELGARLAEPGEFTRRAFLNDKLDLAQAEAVADLIGASTELSLASARGRLKGAFSGRVNEIKEALVELMAHLEAELDFTEEEIEGLASSEIRKRLEMASGAIELLLKTYNEGRAIREGVRSLILGRPNAGKSSLLNILLRQERAIVTPHPGTTRDVIEEAVDIRGLPIRLMDTAGLRDTDDHVEAIGVRLARERIAEADLILFVVDLASPSLEEDTALLSTLEGKKAIVVANKMDLVKGSEINAAKAAFKGRVVAPVSAVTEEGVEALKDLIYSTIAGHPTGVSDTPPGELVASVRHRESLDRALEGLKAARQAIDGGLAREFVAADLRLSLDSLGEITGETTTEDILDRIFSSFCIGK